MSGLSVIEVEAQGQADNLGIQLDDIMASYNGKSLSSVDDLTHAITEARRQQLTAVQILVYRNQQPLTFDASLAPLGVQLAKVATPAIISAISQVKIVDVQMPFSSMVVFMIKLAIAAIPACIILALFCSLIIATLFGTTIFFR